MNKEFMKKIIKAKQLEYEALKELLPEALKGKVETFEDEAIQLFKEIGGELMEEYFKENEKQRSNSKIKKVTIQ